MITQLTRWTGATVLLTFLTACAAAPSAPESNTHPASLKDLTDYVLIDPASGDAVTVAEAADRLIDYDVIFIGESHRHPGNHIAQMALYRALNERGANAALSLEQFERDVQSVVDAYLAGEIGEATLRDKGRAWDNYPVSYRPLVEYAKADGLAVIAAEAPNMVVRCVGREGPAFLDTMPEDKRDWAAAELHLNDGPYKDRFLAFAGGSASHGEASSEDDTVSEAVLRSFAAQVTRDDTMAESIVHYLDANPGGKVVHLNGSFHSAAFLGTAERVAWRRPSLKIAVVHPIEVEDPTDLSIPEGKAGEGTLLLMIQAQPEAYASEQEERDAIMAQMRFRSEVDCEL